MKLPSISTNGAVSLAVLLAFSVVAVLAMTHRVDTSSQVVLYVVSTLGTLATTIVSYWVGSSAGSAEKTRLLAGGTTPSAPPPTVGAGPADPVAVDPLAPMKNLRP